MRLCSIRLAALAAVEAQLGASLLALRRRAAMQRAAAARSLGRLASQRPGQPPASQAYLTALMMDDGQCGCSVSWGVYNAF